MSDWRKERAKYLPEQRDPEPSAAQGRDWMKLLVWFGPPVFVALCFLIGWLA